MNTRISAAGRSGRGTASALLLLVFFLAGVLAPWIAPYDIEAMDLTGRLLMPFESSARWLGADELGRGVLSRLLRSVRRCFQLAVAGAGRGAGWLLLIQFVSCVVIASLLLFLPLNEYWSVALEGTMVCLICPTATAAAVITGKLGGSAASLTTYTLLSNLLAAVIVPLVFPLVEPSDMAFGESFLRILG